MTVRYATVTQLNAHLPASAQVDTEDAADVAAAERLLDRASELIDDHVRAPYSVNSDDEPTDPDIVAALTLAVVCQYEQWLEVGEENSIDGLAGAQIAVAGYSGLRAPDLAPRARAALRSVNLLQPWPAHPGVGLGRL